MFSIHGTTINLTRGDTFKAKVTIYDRLGKKYLPVEGDVVRFALKSAGSDLTPLLIKTIDNESLTLILESSDTADLLFGRYTYDIQIIFKNGDVDTFIDQGVFNLVESLGNA